MCTGGEFTEKGITALMRQSAELLMEANMFESVDEVYKLLTKIYVEKRQNAHLGALHKNLTAAYERMHVMGERTCFRVIIS